MTSSIKNLETTELQLICGGVTEGPDGQGCTEPPPFGFELQPDERGGPVVVDIALSL